MSVYVVPQVLVFQEFNLIPQATLRQLHAHISGGHAWLVRYDDEQEKDTGLLGYYDRVNDTCYDWPQRPAGGVIDHGYTKVFIDDALLQYFADYIGTDDPISTVAGKTNRIAAETRVFRENGEDWPRSDIFYDRDVQLGDVAHIRAVVGASVYDLWTYVSGFVGDEIDPLVGDAEPDVNNEDTRVKPADLDDQIAGDHNCVAIETVDSTLYDGTADGDLTETYTIRVIESSAGGIASTALLRVTSASGNDDDLTVRPDEFGSPTEIGSRGLTITWNNTGSAECSASAEDADVAADDFLVGQEWEVTVGQKWDAPEATSGGDYVGDVDCTYIVTVIRGGDWASLPHISVTTDRGTDRSGAVDVPGAGEAVPVGSNGVTISFTEDGLCTGDIYYIPVEALGHGAIRTLELGDSLPQEVIDNGATEIDLELYIRKNIQVGEDRTEAAPLVNWTQSDTEVCLNEGITAYDDSWTHDGVPQPLPVYSEDSEEYGKVYVEYRAWRSDLCNTVGSIYDVAQLNDYIEGALHPDNPLKWGVFKALSNSNGVAVKYSAVCDPSQVENWVDVLDLIDGRDDVYGLVPLTRDKTVLDLFQAHVGSQSSPEMGRWRVAWFNMEGKTESVVLNATNSTDGEEVLATLEDDPFTSGTQYTWLRTTTGNGRFVTRNVRAGDIVRFMYDTDGFDNVTYLEFVVDAVINQDTIRLLTGHSVAVTTPRKIEIWRNLNAYEQAEYVALTEGYTDRRVRMVWPDTVGSGGILFEGFHLCAALAGLSSGVVSHQGLTRLAINGFDDLTRTTQAFNRTQLNTMAGGGTWIVTQDDTGAVFTRHAVTTGAYDDINQREEMITRNVDAISYYFFDTYDPYIGISNVTPSLIALLRAETKAAIMFLKSNNYVARLGSQLIDGVITDLRPHITLRDRVVIALSLTVPYALNNIEVHLVI